MTTARENFNREEQPQQPSTQTWEPAKFYQEGELVWENNGEAFECIRGGRSGNEKPHFPVGSRVAVDDAEVMWRGYPRMNRKPAERLQGTVKWFNSAKGFGFLTTPGHPDIFVHFTAIQASGYRELKEGQTVEYDIVHSSKGPAAEKVVVIG